MFTDRNEAGYLLANKLEKYKGTNAVILAIPRGGIPLGFIVSKELNLPLEVVLSKKIGHPFHKEYAIGAVTLKNRILSDAAEGISQSYIDEETERIRTNLNQRYREYYGDKKPISLKDKILIIVDDGIATGNTMLSIIDMLHDEKPDKIVIATPVSPPDSIEKLEAASFVDEVICLITPHNFTAVGQFYQNFNQVTDKEAKQLLEKQFTKL